MSTPTVNRRFASVVRLAAGALLFGVILSAAPVAGAARAQDGEAAWRHSAGESEPGHAPAGRDRQLLEAAIEELEKYRTEVEDFVSELDGKLGYDRAPQTLLEYFGREGVDWARRYAESWGNNNYFVEWSDLRDYFQTHARFLTESIRALEGMRCEVPDDMAPLREGMKLWRDKAAKAREVFFECGIPYAAKQAKALDEAHKAFQRYIDIVVDYDAPRAVWKAQEAEKARWAEEQRRSEEEADRWSEQAAECLDPLDEIMSDYAFEAIEDRPIWVRRVEIVEPDPPYAPLDALGVGESFRVTVAFNDDPGCEAEPVTVRNKAAGLEIRVLARPTESRLIYRTDPVRVVPAVEP